MPKSDLIERIVILADGTGNAFSTQESNVWRLYEALDLTDPKQVACYIEGVGTSRFRPFAILDGATGIGVPSNVRKLYCFLCWNWRPGVEIHMFGFSRGAFTIRTLIAMIDSEGLVPRAFPDGPVARHEMKRNAMSAWRRYRAKSAKFRDVAWTVSLTRLVRDLLLGILRLIRRDRPYGEVQAEVARQERRTIPITFAGLFDTVEAYGVPIEELRRAINWAIWPISFRNFELSPIVARARHALSLDDERTTFHPVRIDVTKEDATGIQPRVREVWFAGVHSDVGGGYPDDELAYVPLAWMMGEAAAASPGSGLTFHGNGLAAAVQRASAIAPVHDSRAGMAALYRYGPRRTDDPRVSEDTPIVHHSVAEKMVFGTENYAPLTLPAVARVLMPDDRLQPFHGFQTRIAKKTGSSFAPATEDEEHRAEQALALLKDPNGDFVDLTRDMIWWRRVGYFALLIAVVLAASLPWTAAWLSERLTRFLIFAGRSLAPDDWVDAWQRHLADAEHGLGSNLNDLSASLGGFVPSYAQAWVQAIVGQPLVSLSVLGLAFLIYRWNAALGDRIGDLARCAWFINQQSPDPVTAPRPLASRVARLLRHSRLADALVRLVADVLFPTLFLAAVASVAFIAIERTTIGYRAGAGALCRASVEDESLVLPQEGVPMAPPSRWPWTTDNPCWRTGVLVEKGRAYTVWIEMKSPYLDRLTPVGVSGFKTDAFLYALAAPFRRWWNGDWFQPMARIGESGTVEWPLQPVDGAATPTLDKSRIAKLDSGVVLHPGRIGEKAPAAAVNDAGTLPNVRRLFVASFTAQATGELFLFVNDVLLAVPFGPTIYSFYLNNSGTAAVTIELTPEPKPHQ